MKLEVAFDVIYNCAGFDDVRTPVGEAWDEVVCRVAELESAMRRINEFYDMPLRVKAISDKLLEEK